MDDEILKLKAILAHKFDLNIHKLLYKDLTPNIKGSNRILLFGENEYTHIVKLLPVTDRYIGEESLDEIIYDACVHSYLANKGIFQPSRTIVEFSDSNENDFESKYIVQRIVPGEPLNTFSPLDIQKYLLEAINKLAFISHSIGSVSNRQILTFNSLKIDQFNSYEPYLIQYAENRKKIINNNFYVYYFESDVKRHASDKYKADLLNFISSADFLNLSHYHLIHGDIKPKNIIIDSTGKPILIDWSKAYFGDIAQDIAYYIASIFKFYKKAFTEEDLKDVVYLYIKNNINLGAYIERRVYFYLCIILFSISWIHKKDDLDLTCELILDSNYDLGYLLPKATNILSHSW